MRALVLSGGGLFGAWQAGAWKMLAPRFEPDLIVGASIGSVNGYLIAAGIAPDKIEDMWRNPQFTDRKRLHANLRQLTAEYPLQRPFAITVTDWLTMKPVTYRDQEISWQHLAASCAVPPAMPQVKLAGRWTTDGGLLNPVPLWAAVDLGATEILALHVLADFPSKMLAPIVRTFRYFFGYNPPLPADVARLILSPSQKLGGLRDTLYWSPEAVERWLKLGESDAIATIRGYSPTPEKAFPF